jgi:tetratricopeptide (TPR) repeat protein
VHSASGVGKTALAVHWAHHAAGRFPDGQLYVNLRGYGRDQPMCAADALARFLRALGVASQDIPVDEDERAARYRTLVAGRRMLVVLDNTRSVEQVRPLLPGTAACTVVVTSRDALAGLVARDGAIRLDLDLLPLADAVNLLRALIGTRVDTDPDAAEALADLCSCLPLALRVAAELASARRATPLTDLVTELTDQQLRLDLLDAGGDPRTAVRAVFSWSYCHLDANSARAFRRAGLHPGPDFDPYAVAALTGATLEQSRRVLDVLARTHLIQQTGPGRYGMHDLLRAYARELATAHDGEDAGRAALTRLFDYYLHTAVVAMDTLFPADRYRRPRIRTPADSAPTLTGPATARSWLDAERTALVAVAEHAGCHSWPGHAIRLADNLYRYLIWGSHAPEALTILTSALRAARETSDRAAEAAALNSLGAFDLLQDRHQQAADRFRQAVDLSREVGDQPGEARAVLSLGWIDVHLGRYQQAADRFRQAVDLSREVHDLFAEGRALTWLGRIDVLLGRYQSATDLLQHALARCRLAGDQNGEGYTLTRLGEVDLHEGRYREAADRQRQAVDIFREIGDRAGEARALNYLGEADVHLGQYVQAIGHHEQAAELYREINNQAGVAEVLNGLGKAHLAADRPTDARIQHTLALGLASRTGRRFEQARAHDGLARAWQALGDSRACRHWQQALDLYVSLGSPAAEEIRTQLAMTGT